MAIAVTDWAEGNTRSANREAERALRALLEGKLGDADRDRDNGENNGKVGGGQAGGSRARSVPVPLGLCLAASAMLLATSICGEASG